MGIAKEVIAIYGYMGGFHDFISKEDFEWVKEEAQHKYKNVIEIGNDDTEVIGSPILICDGMGGQYSCFGVLVNRFGKDRYEEDRDVEMQVGMAEMKLLDQSLQQMVEQFNINTEEMQPALHLFTHYT